MRAETTRGSARSAASVAAAASGSANSKAEAELLPTISACVDRRVTFSSR